jgi:hypothetical protein
MEVRLIKETVNGNRRKAICELGSKNRYDQPLIIIMKPSGSMLTIHGRDSLEKYINVDKIPKDFEILRINSIINSGIIYTDENSRVVRIYSTLEDLRSISKIFYDCVIEEFAKLKIDIKRSSHRLEANDLVFTIDGKDKKFCGVLQDRLFRYFSFFICFDFDATKIEGLYKLDTQKVSSRGDVNDITDIVGGLKEVSPKIKDTIVDSILTNIATKLKWELKDSTFTKSEEITLSQLSN